MGHTCGGRSDRRRVDGRLASPEASRIVGGANDTDSGIGFDVDGGAHCAPRLSRGDARAEAEADAGATMPEDADAVVFPNAIASSNGPITKLVP